MKKLLSSIPTKTGNLNCFTGRSFPCGSACFGLSANCQRVLQKEHQSNAQVLIKSLGDRLKENITSGKSKDYISSSSSTSSNSGKFLNASTVMGESMKSI